MTKASSESVWIERVLAWRESGRSAAKFCEGEPFHPASLLSWSSRLGREGKVSALSSGRKPQTSPEPVGTRFARVVTRANAVRDTRSTVAVAVGASRIEVTQGFDAALLRAVVEALAEDGAR